MLETSVDHVAIIMDGNGRWAKERGLPRSMGHKKGLEAVEKAIEYARKNNVKVLSLYAFSTENWNRSVKEINFLFNAFKEYLNKKKDSLLENGIRLTVSGTRDGLRQDLIETIDNVQNFTAAATDMTLNICFNYGGKTELVDVLKTVAKEAVEGKLSIESIDQNTVAQRLYNSIPDIDLLIRTSGEARISNFMLWQAAYAEFYFIDTKWPDFDEKCFEKALIDYKKRSRRFGAEA